MGWWVAIGLGDADPVCGLKSLQVSAGCIQRTHLQTKDPTVNPPHSTCPLTSEATWGQSRAASRVPCGEGPQAGAPAPWKGAGKGPLRGASVSPRVIYFCVNSGVKLTSQPQIHLGGSFCPIPALPTSLEAWPGWTHPGSSSILGYQGHSVPGSLQPVCRGVAPSGAEFWNPQLSLPGEGAQSFRCRELLGAKGH